MSKSRQDIIEACYRFRWDVESKRIYGSYTDVSLAVRDVAYDPCAGTPEGRKQANKLWRKLAQTHCVGFSDAGPNLMKKCSIWLPRQVETLTFVYKGYGPWWNSALAAAVAELVEASKQKEPGKEVPG